MNVLMVVFVVLAFSVVGICVVSVRALREQEAQVPDTTVVQTIYTDKDLLNVQADLDKANLNSLDVGNQL